MLVPHFLQLLFLLHIFYFSTLQLESSILLVLSYMFYTLSPPPSLSLSLCVVSSLAVCMRNLVGGRHEEHSHVSRRVLKEKELTDSPRFREGGREGAIAKSHTLFFSPPPILTFLHSRLLNGLQYTEAIAV